MSTPLINFGISWLTKSSAPIQIFTAEDAISQLTQAASSYLSARVKVDSIARQVECIYVVTYQKITLPKLMDWYADDFGKTKSELLQWLLKMLYASNFNLKEMIDERYSIIYDKFDWGFQFSTSQTRVVEFDGTSL